ncbi:MAG: EscD/YscD/HrpQ family type III secretion system periplasmic domain-containing protein [Geminicoccaceae bacterium]
MISVIVATGRNAGARRDLEEGRYRIGSDLEGDIVLHDPDIPARLLSIEVGDNRLRLTAHAENVGLQAAHGGRAVSLEKDRPRSVATPAVVRIGTTCLLFSEMTSSDTPADPPAGGPPERRSGLMAGGIAAMAVLVASIAIGSASFGSDPDPRRLAAERLESLGLESRLLLQQSRDGRPLIRGLLESGHRIAEVESAFADIDSHLTLSSMDRIEPALGALLDGEIDRVHWSILDRGGVRLEGVVGESMTRDRIGRSLVEAVPGVTATDNRLLTLAEVAEAVSARLTELELSPQLVVERSSGGLEVKGTTTAADRPRIDELRAWFDRRYGQFMQLDFATEDQKAGDPLDDLQAVMLGEDPRLVMRGNRHVRPGGEVGHGWIVETIGKDRIVLVRGEENRIVVF